MKLDKLKMLAYKLYGLVKSHMPEMLCTLGGGVASGMLCPWRWSVLAGCALGAVVGVVVKKKLMK